MEMILTEEEAYLHEDDVHETLSPPHLPRKRAKSSGAISPLPRLDIHKRNRSNSIPLDIPAPLSLSPHPHKRTKSQSLTPLDIRAPLAPSHKRTKSLNTLEVPEEVTKRVKYLHSSIQSYCQNTFQHVYLAELTAKRRKNDGSSILTDTYSWVQNKRKGVGINGKTS